MQKSIVKRLDLDAKERLGVLREKFHRSREIDAQEVFSSREVAEALKQSKIVLQSFNTPRILTSIPLYKTVMIEICPLCGCVGDTAIAKPILASTGIVPVLIAPYLQYPEKFVAEILKLPHINAYEYNLFRNATLYSQADDAVCRHCVATKREKLFQGIEADSMEGEILGSFFQLLVPFVNPDYELIGEMEKATRDGDVARMLQIRDLANSIHELRTSQAFSATIAVPLEQLQTLPQGSVAERLIRPLSSHDVKNFVAEELGLLLPTEMEPEKYLEIVVPHRERLSGLIDDILTKPGTNSLQPVIETIETINDEIRSVQGKTRFLAYRAAVGLASGNQALIASLLVGGALAAGGHLGLCTATAAIGAGIKALGKFTKIRTSKVYQDTKKAVVRQLQPQVAKVLAKYLGITPRAVEVWQLRQQLIVDGSEKTTKSTPKRSVKGTRRSNRRVR